MQPEEPASADRVSGRTTSAGRVRTWYVLAAILLLNTVAIFAILEVAARTLVRARASLTSEVAEPGDPRASSSFYETQPWAAQYWREFTASRRVRYQPYTLWRRAPFRGETINVDERGNRITPGARCQPGAFKVFVFGGSPTWGTGSPDWATIPAYIQASLDRSRSGPVCVVNFGESGYVSTQSAIELILQLQDGNVPDLALFFDGTNDVYAGYQSGRAGVHENMEQVAARLERRPVPGEVARVPLIGWSVLYELVANRVVALSQPAAPAKLMTYEARNIDRQVLTESIIRTYLSNYVTVTGLTRAYDFDAYFFWPPCICAGHKALTHEEEALKRAIDPALKALYDSVYKALRPRIQQYRNLIWLGDVFDTRAELIWLDDVHVTPHGNELLASEVLHAIAPSSE